MAFRPWSRLQNWQWRRLLACEIRQEGGYSRTLALLQRLTACATAMICLGASGAEAEAEAIRRGPKTLETFGFLLFAVVALGLLIWSIAMVRRRLAERQAEEEKAARMLEAQVMSVLANRQTTAAQESPARPAAADAAASGSPVSAASAAASAALGGTATDSAQAVEVVLTRLRSGGLLVGLEGTLYLSDGQSEGKIIRLRDGKTAVVLPRLETAEFLARQIKRFDMCIVVLAADQFCVVSPLSAYIADHIAL